MRTQTSLLLLLDFALIGGLPALTFRRGTLHLRWWLTASPLLLASALAGAWGLGALDPAWQPVPLEGRAAAVTVLTVTSLVLMAATVGTHRIPLSLWHQDDDAPVHIVTWGPYRLVRHPFYVSFLLAVLAVVVAVPHPLSVLAFALGAGGLTLTASREERRLLASDLREEYAAYLRRTGRFVPRPRLSAP